jgi:hypothetical protein
MDRKGSIVAGLAAGLALLFAGPAEAQHEEHSGEAPAPAAEPAAPAGPSAPAVKAILEGREIHFKRLLLAADSARTASGTSWQPDAVPAHGPHFSAAGFDFAVHGNLFLVGVAQLSSRGENGGGAINWLMATADKDLGTSRLQFRAGLSLEPLTLPGRGYPLLLQTGETFGGEPNHDYQHPHDLFTELAATYRYALTEDIGVQVYGGPVGEPALGPVGFSHRASAQVDPFAPIGHHWQDSTHVTFGVVTAGFFSKYLKLEGSWFNGREPDEDRWAIELRSFDSASARLSLNPVESLSIQGSYGYLASPDAREPAVSLKRGTASLTYASRLPGGAFLSLTGAWGRNIVPREKSMDSALVEGSYDLDGHHVVFARIEYVEKTSGSLALPGLGEHAHFGVAELGLGYQYALWPIFGVLPSFGVRANAGYVPDTVATFYGTAFPVGFAVFTELKPAGGKHAHAAE